MLKSRLPELMKEKEIKSIDKLIREMAKKDIQSLIKGIDKEDIKLVFYNAKYYINYI